MMEEQRPARKCGLKRPRSSWIEEGGGGMTKEDFDPLAFTTAVNTLAVAVAQNLSEDELALLTAVLVQLTGTLTTITVQQTLYGKQKDGQTS